jgi:hypothetical protein
VTGSAAGVTEALLSRLQSEHGEPRFSSESCLGQRARGDVMICYFPSRGEVQLNSMISIVYSSQLALVPPSRARNLDNESLFRFKSEGSSDAWCA